MKSFFYILVQLSLRCYNHFYFKRFRLYGLDNIPKEGGIIFSPNHQAAFLDPLIIGTTCNKKVISLTRSDVFGGTFQWFLDALNMLPVYRIRDGYNSLKKNDAIFDKCRTALANGGAITMFSEGTHHKEYYLQSLSKGSSRMALEAQSNYPKKPIYIVPVGINYSHHILPWQELHIVYGKPIAVQDYLHDYTNNSSLTINQLKEELRFQMKSCIWLPENDDSYLEKKEFINLRNTKYGFSKFKHLLHSNHSELKKTKSGGVFLKFVVALLGIPNLIPLFIIRKITRLFKEPVFHSSIKYAGGLFIFMFWWVLLVLIGLFFGGTSIAITLFVVSFILLYFRQTIISTYFSNRI